jgi:CHAT domain-containing protein
VELESLTVAIVMQLLAGKAGSGGWLNAYLSWLNNRNSFPELFQALDALTASLWDVLVGPIDARLKKLGIDSGAPVIIMPSGWLGILPLHAARRREGERWTAFGAEYVVSYAPSIGALEACRQRLEARSRESQTLFAVANPTGDLRFAGDETASIAELFVERANSPGAARVLAGDAATRANVIGEVPGASYVHFACHAEFHWANAAESGLLLAKGDRLSIEDILSPAMDLGSSHLITLSACETGMTEFRTMPDEFIGLAGALLEAGAPAVISSLWPVDDVSTKLLLTEMYRLHLGGMSIAAALQGAVRWVSEATAEELGLAAAYQRNYAASGSVDEAALRSWQYYEKNMRERPFAHPFYWAAFTLTGAP